MTSPDKPSDPGCPELQPAFVEALSTADFSADIAKTSTTRELADRIAASAAPAQPDEWEAYRLELAALIAEETPRQVIRGEIHNDHPHAYSAFIDWLNFTFRWHLTTGESFRAFDEELRECFGFGLGACRNKGHLNYKESWVLGDDLGFFATGGDSVGGTSFVTISGKGCHTIAHWGRVHDFIARHKGRITRIDLAYDDLEGLRDVAFALSLYLSGQFSTNAGRPPSGQLIDDFDSGKGKTLYIGNRKNGKLLRVYEKGKQLGDAASPWTRWEVELHNKDREIPLRIIYEPSRFLAGSYPCMDWASSFQSSRIKTVQETARIGLDVLLKHCRLSYGKLIWVMRDVLDYTPEQIVQALSVEGYPERLNLPLVAESQP